MMTLQNAMLATLTLTLAATAAAQSSDVVSLAPLSNCTKLGKAVCCAQRPASLSFRSCWRVRRDAPDQLDQPPRRDSPRFLAADANRPRVPHHRRPTRSRNAPASLIEALLSVFAPRMQTRARSRRSPAW
jgi:hypothetical protein